MVTQPSSLALTLLANQSHGFFESFPRELRDNVYDLLCQDVTRESGALQYHTRTKILNLRLVSRDFKLEYDEQCSKSKHVGQLTVTDSIETDYCGCDLPASLDIKRLSYPAPALQVIEMTATLSVCDGDHDNSCIVNCRISGHGAWIGDLIRNLPHLQSVHIQLKFPGNTCVCCGLEFDLDIFTKFPKIVELKTIGSEAETGSASSSITLATWTREHGLQKNHEAIKQCRERALASMA
jgi:hypothetical protein